MRLTWDKSQSILTYVKTSTGGFSELPGFVLVSYPPLLNWITKTQKDEVMEKIEQSNEYYWF